MRTFTIKNGKGVNPCIEVSPSPTGVGKFALALSDRSHILFDREHPASVVWVGEGHPVVRTAKVTETKTLALSNRGLSIESEQSDEVLVLLEYYWVPQDGELLSSFDHLGGGKLIGSAVVEDEIEVIIGWENTDPHDRFTADARRIRELVVFKEGSYQQIGILEAEKRDGRSLYSTLFVRYDGDYSSEWSETSPRLSLLSVSKFKEMQSDKERLRNMRAKLRA